MATAKITLSASRDIPFNKLVLSQSNVRRVKAGISIEELAEDIARRSLLQSLSVRAVLDAGGTETGMFEVPAGGRRFRALELLVKQKRMKKTEPVPCVVRTDGLAEEDSLAENVQRADLHPLDQFCAFQTLREKGLSEEDIAHFEWFFLYFPVEKGVYCSDTSYIHIYFFFLCSFNRERITQITQNSANVDTSL
jgi:ParB family chromosome partitioning protein